MAMMDWPTTVSEFRSRFAGRIVRTGPKGVSGENFMTPECLGYVRADDGSSVEVSTGTGIYHDRIFGVTWPRLPGVECDPRDACCFSLGEVERVLSLRLIEGAVLCAACAEGDHEDCEPGACMCIDMEHDEEDWEEWEDWDDEDLQDVD